jgi:hypothetical protein
LSRLAYRWEDPENDIPDRFAASELQTHIQIDGSVSSDRLVV